ncbi:sugar ABC transporter ATP-binding protein [Verrucomicrobiota bacterium]
MQQKDPGIKILRLEMQDICKKFGATTALSSVSLRVHGGEAHALIGENGAGKSTLMKILSGALLPDKGHILLDGHPFRPADPMAARKAGIAMIYQELSLAPHLSVSANIMLGIEPERHGLLDQRSINSTAAIILKRLKREDISPDAIVGRLPPASRQLVEIARALATGCRVMILDEPTSSLGSKDAGRLFNLLAELKKTGIAIVYISHFLEEIRQVADSFTVLRDGSNAGSDKMAGTQNDEIVHLMIGRKISQLYPHSSRRRLEPVLELEGIAGGRDSTAKPIEATLTLYRGEITGIAGLVGSGRTELMRIIFGLDKIRSGKIKIGSLEGYAPPARRWQQGIGMMSEDRKNEGLAVNMSVADNLCLSRLDLLGSHGLIYPKRQASAAKKWIEKMQIRCNNPYQVVTGLSGGNQQKLALARLLFHDVDILLLDEPTRGIDVASKAQIYSLINELATGSAGRPKAVLIISSYLPELLGICDRIAVMRRGRLEPARQASELEEHQLMLEATGTE